MRSGPTSDGRDEIEPTQIPHSPLDRSTSWQRSTLVLAIGTFLQMFGMSYANAALPGIVSAFDADLATASWILGGEALGMSTGMLVAGLGSDRWGRRRLFCCGLIAYGLTSAASAGATSIEVLAATRIAVGLASGPLLAGGLALLWQSVDDETRPRAMALYAAVSASAAVLAPLSASFALRYASWQLGFAVIAPCALLAVPWVLWTFSSDELARPNVDVAWGRALLTGAAIGGLLFVLSAPTRGGPSGWELVLVLACAVALLLRIEWRSARRLLPGVMRSRIFARALLASVAAGLAFGASLFAIPMFVVEVWNRPPASAALVMAPAAIAAIVGAVAAGPAIARAGYGPVIASALWIACGAMAALALLGPTSPLPLVVAIGVGGGLAFGLGGPAIVGSALASVPEDAAGTASAWYNTARSFGSAMGVAGFSLAHGSAGADGGSFRVAFAATAAAVGLLAWSWQAVGVSAAGASPAGRAITGVEGSQDV